MRRSLSSLDKWRFRGQTCLLRKRRGARGRSGSTLLMVVALMGMLMFLGFVFYTFASQERTNAANAAQAMKAQTAAAAAAEPDDLFDFVLQTIILGPNDFNYQSILWGGRHSLLGNMYGRDGVPWNGEGVNLVSIGGQPYVDMDGDGTTTITSNGLNIPENINLLNVVDSPVANVGAWNNNAGTAKWGTNKNIYLGAGVSGPFNPTPPYVPTPDIGYNSPDVNSMFLSYDGNATNAAGTTQSRVIIPSYLRPQYLRTGGTPYTSYYTSANPWYFSAPANQIMRPHPNHFCVDTNGNILTQGGTPIPRYVSLSDAQSYTSLGLRRPFTSYSYSPETAAGIAASGNLGIWSGSAITPTDMSADVDSDGDGVMDAILMDLGYPPIRRGDNKYVVPLFAISIRDLNGLINVNASGNLSGNLNLTTINANNQLGFKPLAVNTYTADNLSQSDQGLSTNEINVQRVLTATPADVVSNNPEIAQQLAYFLYQFDSTVTTTSPPQPGRSTPELANLEWLLLNIGRAQFSLGLAPSASPIQNAITNVIPGRNGEPLFTNNTTPSLLNFLSTFGANGQLYMPRAGQAVSSYSYPTWSVLAADDNNNGNEGEGNYATRWVNPLDFRAGGIRYHRMGFGPDGQPGNIGFDDDGNGLIDDYIEAGWPGTDDPQSLTPPVQNPMMIYRTGALLWPAYSGFHTYGAVQWGEAASTTYNTQLMRNPIWYSQLDDPTEAILDPVLMSPAYSGSLTTVNTVSGGANPSNASVNNAIGYDSVFGPQEMLFLQGSNLDNRQTESQSRLAELMPANLVASSNASDIRKRLTTISTDRREFGLGINPVGQLRAEAAGSAAQYAPWESTPQFPPDALYASAPNPYRNELFYYLSQTLATASLKLNVNRLLYLNSASTQYGFAPLPQQTSVTDANATIARQNMARDIYTLLYTLCQGQDTDYRTATAANAPTAAQAQEMAQFAVNLVDALDTDNIITAFYYDNDLTQAGVLDAGGGWTAAAATNVVYGVERQLLTFSEAMAFRVGAVAAPTTNDSPMTIFDDKTSGVDGRRYVYFELENVTPLNVTLASSGVTAANATTNGDWRVRLQDASSGTDLNILYFLNGGLDLPNNLVNTDGSGNKYLTPGQTFTVSSQDGSDKFTDTSSGTFRTSDFRMSTVLPGSAATSAYTVYVPSARYTGAVDAGVTAPMQGTAGSNFPKPNCNLDLVWDGYGGVALPSSRFYLSSNNGTAGAFASPVTKAVASVQLVLERRVADGSATGVWAAVDKTKTIVVNSIPVPDNSVQMAGDVPTAVTNLQSYPRSAPLLRTSETSGVNTLNKAPTTAGTAWQWQPDRDFASLGELLLLPVYGPDALTNGRITNSEFYQDPNSMKYYPTLASARFLRPDNPDLALNGTTPNNGNRWYRLLDFLEVQNRGHQHPLVLGIPTTSAITWGTAGPFGTPATFAIAPIIGSTASTATPSNPSTGLDNFPLAEPYNLAQYFGWPRTHGQVNLNMIRDPQVFAALVDDDTLINDPRFMGYIDPRYGNQIANSSMHATDEASRMWWVEFLKSRESRAALGFAVDPVTNLYVPGTASARPFRSFDSVTVNATNTTDSPLENTVLRSLPLDNGVSPNPNEGRRLLEVGLNGSEHFGQPATEVQNAPLHPSSRYQVLSKLMNNTTTRSNSFAVYVTVQYYEAAEVATDSGVTAYRIGGELTDTPVNRAFFVIDRTSAVEQMKILSKNGVNPTSSNGTYSFSPNTDTTGLRANMNGIRWKDLVLFRQTLN